LLPWKKESYFDGLVGLCVCVLGEVALGQREGGGKGLVVHLMQQFSKAFLLTPNQIVHLLSIPTKNK
jgi:hypothetical protein